MRFLIVFFLVFGSGFAQISDPIDVVIPAIEKDLDTLDQCIEGIRSHGGHVRRVIVISPAKLTDKAEWFPEDSFPFSKEEVALEIFSSAAVAQEFLKSPSRIGWIYQQLLKFYAPFVIPDLSPNVLILDADTLFLKDVSFIDEEGVGLYNIGSGYHSPYFAHMARLLPGLGRVYPQYSGICHHMLFQRNVLEELFEEIETYHGKEAWRAIAGAISPREAGRASLSEYEIYFNYIFSKEKPVKIRLLKWANIGNLDAIPFYEADGYDYVSCHTWMRKKH